MKVYRLSEFKTDKCPLGGCQNKATSISSRWCSTHYYRWKKYGSPWTLKEPKHGHSNSELYRVWSAMRRRINNPNTADYPYYGGRGIKICERWNIYTNFLEDMVLGYEKGLTLDRIDSNGDYSPQNCRWATRKEQANNLRSNYLFTYKSCTLTIAQWADKTGLGYATIHYRIHNNWPKRLLFSPAEGIRWQRK